MDSDEDFGERLVAVGPCGIDHDWDSVEIDGLMGHRDFFEHPVMVRRKTVFHILFVVMDHGIYVSPEYDTAYCRQETGEYQGTPFFIPDGCTCRDETANEKQ